MSRLDSISDRVMDLVGQVGDGIRDHMPTRNGTLLRTGAALGAARTGSRVAGHFLRRNPALVVATVIGAGAAWYAVHRYRKKQAAGETLDGQSRRIEPSATARRNRTRRKAAAAQAADE